MRSINVPGRVPIHLDNSVVELAFRGRMIEINKYIDFKELFRRLDEILTKKWPMQKICIVAHGVGSMDQTTFVYQFDKEQTSGYSACEATFLKFDEHVSFIYPYLVH